MVARQSMPEVMRPPPIVPTTKPRDSRAPLTPIALVRLGPSSNAVVIRASAVGPIAAAATPCPARAAMSIAGETASPASSEQAVKPATPRTNSRRRPTRSEARANSGMSAAVGSRQAVATHWRPPVVAKSRSRPISGRATVMIE